MENAALAAVFSTLEEHESVKPVVLFVGGCVRNSVLGRRPSDIDLATRLEPDTVMKKLTAKGIKALPTGIEHGTVTAVINGSAIEITTLRRDVSTDGRRAVVTFTDDWREDARRRDFTINTLLMDQKGHIYDPTGQGLADLKAGRVRFVGDARQRVQEDYLRILRFFRFYAVYGKEEPDEAALAACTEFSGRISRLSKERITQEFRRILMTDDSAPVLELMFKNKVLHDLPAPDFDLSGLNEGLVYPARLLVLTAREEKEIGRLERYLVLSRQEKKMMQQILASLSALEMLSEKSVKVSLYRYGRDVTSQATILKSGGQVPAAMQSFIKNEEIPAFPLTGEDIKAAGIAQGPEIGEILHGIEQWWIEKDFKPDRAACLKKIGR